MSNVIKFKRGDDVSLPNPIGSGEPLWSEDLFKLYVGVNSSSSKWVGAEIDNGTTLGTSQTKLATQYAIKTYVDDQVDTVDTIAELGDTTIASISNAQVMVFDDDGGGSDDTWKNVTISSDATITNAGVLTIADDAVSNTKLANIAQGSVKVGGGSNAPTDLDAKTSGQILVGDGTDIASVAVSGDVTLASDGAITIGNDKIDSQHYAAASIDNEHLADDAVDSDELAAGSVDLAHMSVNSIDSDQYVDGSIDLIHMSADSVDSDQYVDGSIDNEHIADNAIDSEHYVDGSIDNEHLADSCVDSDELAAGSVDDGHLSDGVATGLAGTGITATSGVLSIDVAQAITSVTGDFTVTGDLVVSGDTVTTNVATVEIEDPMVRLATSNAADTYDMGMYGKYVATGTKYAGVFRDRSVTGDPWTFFDTLSTEPASAGDVTVGSNNFEYAPIRCADITGSGAVSGNGNLSGFDIDGGTY